MEKKQALCTDEKCIAPLTIFKNKSFFQPCTERAPAKTRDRLGIKQERTIQKSFLYREIRDFRGSAYVLESQFSRIFKRQETEPDKEPKLGIFSPPIEALQSKNRQF